MSKWLKTSESTKINAYTQISEKTGMAVAAVEKVWWVVQVLATIFEMSVGKHLVFKKTNRMYK
jgi:hypothetical protein